MYPFLWTKNQVLGRLVPFSCLKFFILWVVLVLGFECCAIRLSYCIAIEQYYVKSCLSSEVELTFSVRGKKKKKNYINLRGEHLFFILKKKLKKKIFLLDKSLIL
jgi:hypothetical protein